MFSKYEEETTVICSFCPALCLHACPLVVGELEESYAPSLVMGLIHLWQKGKISLDEELARLFYACTDCGACTAHCQQQQRPQDILWAIRPKILAEKLAPQPVLELIEKYRSSGNSLGFSSSFDDLPFLSDERVGLLVSTEFFKNSPEKLKDLLRLLKKIFAQPIALLPPDLTAGEVLYATGERELHDEHAKKFQKATERLETLIVTDPAALYHLRHYRERADLSLAPQVFHFLEVIREELFVAPDIFDREKVFYLDPSALGRGLDIYDKPRKLLSFLGFEVLDFYRHRRASFDNASGGVYPFLSPEGARRAAAWLLREVFDHQARFSLEVPPKVITVGEKERHHLAASEPNLTILDLNQLLAQYLR